MTAAADGARRSCWLATVRRPAVWGAAFASVLVLSLLKFTYLYLDDRTRDHAGTLLTRLIEETGGVLYAPSIIVGIVAVAWCYPLGASTWRRYLPLHVGTLVVFSVVHTSLHWGARVVLFPLAGLGAYDYGRMPLRYFMEFPNDTIVYGAMLVAVASVRYYRTMRDRELSLAQAQLRNLRLQLQPHFLFNALNTISATMYDDPAAADAMIGELSELLRVSLRTADTQEVPLRMELEALAHYTALMRARFGERLSVDIDIEPAAADALVPSLILQPLVENAVRHGNVSRVGVGRIDVRARREGDRLAIEVVDDGPGMVADAAGAPSAAGVAAAAPGADIAASGTGLAAPGIGLRATAERLRLLYGDAHRFSAGNVNGGGHGFAVAIAIPFRPCAS